jgi:hypothetical protein
MIKRAKIPEDPLPGKGFEKYSMRKREFSPKTNGRKK